MVFSSSIFNRVFISSWQIMMDRGWFLWALVDVSASGSGWKSGVAAKFLRPAHAAILARKMSNKYSRKIGNESASNFFCTYLTYAAVRFGSSSDSKMIFRASVQHCLSALLKKYLQVAWVLEFSFVLLLPVSDLSFEAFPVSAVSVRPQSLDHWSPTNANKRSNTNTKFFLPLSLS